MGTAALRPRRQSDSRLDFREGRSKRQVANRRRAREKSLMKITVIGWGSLYWNPGVLAIEPEWYLDGPMLPVEFARFSSRDRLTLVLVDGAPAQPTLWALSKKSTLEEAAADLQTREGCTNPTGDRVVAEAYRSKRRT